jgi:uncharacterized protein YukE
MTKQKTVTPAEHIDWNGYTHQELYGMIMSANPQAIQERAQAVHNFAQDMHNVTGFVHDTAQNMFGLWSGSSAEQAAHTINEVTNWADHTAETASQVAHSLGHYADALNEARNTMPEPINWGAVHKALSGGTVDLSTSGVNAATIQAIEQGHHPSTQQAQQKELENKTKAVVVMRKYHATSASIYHATPTFTNPPGITAVPVDPVEPPPAWPPAGVTWPPPSGPPTGPVDPGKDGGGDTTTTSGAAPMTTTGIGTTGLSPVGVGSGTGSYNSGIAALGGFGSGGLVNDEGGWGGFGSSGGAGAPIVAARATALRPGTASGAAALEETEVAGSRAAMAAEGQAEAGWGGFAPMGGAGGAGGGSDLDHRNRYGLRPDVIGELPEAFPPVLGL